MAKITTQIQGEKEITDKFIYEEYDVVGKFERTINDAVVGDGTFEIPLDNYGTLQKIIINSTNANLNITDGSGSFIIPISGLFTWTVSSTYVATITSLTASTDSSTAVDIDITVIGV